MLGIHQVTTGILQGMGHTALPLINMGIAAIVKVTLNWNLVAIPSLGILGAGWATNADFGVAAMLNLFFVYRYSQFTITITSLVKIVTATAVMGITLYAANEYLIQHMSALLAICADISIAIFVYGVILLLVGELTEQDILRIPLVGTGLARMLLLCGLLKRSS